ncbi:MAG: phosphoribosyl-ATP diphosphatase [Patescibacteria group bacterium]
MNLDQLFAIIKKRVADDVPYSYSNRFVKDPVGRILRKISEEAYELVEAEFEGGDREKVAHEMADLWFHCLLLLEKKGMSPDDIFAEFERRHQQSKMDD